MPSTIPPTTTPHLPAAEIPHHGAVPAAAQPAAGGQEPPVALNAQGGIAEDDEMEGGRRDWLDWLYVMSRFAFLLSILYFYSPFNQFILLTVLIVIVYA